MAAFTTTCIGFVINRSLDKDNAAWHELYGRTYGPLRCSVQQELGRYGIVDGNEVDDIHQQVLPDLPDETRGRLRR
jgi:hypothetical protein